MKRLPLAARVLACAIVLAASIARAASPSGGEESSKFIRFVPDDRGGGTLQASVVRYENPEGVSVDLVAAVHVADRSFFRALNESFNDYDAVLYEMVAARGMLKPSPAASGFRQIRSRDDDAEDAGRQAGAPRRASAMSWIGGLQRFLKNNLQLAFQLDEINYDRPNFIHADLDYETFAKMQEQRGESFFTLMLDSMTREMARGNGGEVDLAQLLFALQRPDRSRQLKLVLARQFDRIDEQMAGMDSGPKGSVLVTERNKAALRTLKQAMSSGKRTIAIFYGAAHLKGMEKTLTDEMGFRRVGPPFWRVAWDMSGLPATQPASAAAPIK